MEVKPDITNKSANSNSVLSGRLPAELDQEMEMKESVPQFRIAF